MMFSSIDKETFIPIEIGSRGDLTPDRAQAAAEFFRKVVARAGPGRIYIHIAGYDEDPRELRDIHEAAAAGTQNAFIDLAFEGHGNLR
jgi:hypothetical protein